MSKYGIFCQKLLKYALWAEKNGCKCAESPLHTFSHSAIAFSKLKWHLFDKDEECVLRAIVFIKRWIVERGKVFTESTLCSNRTSFIACRGFWHGQSNSVSPSQAEYAKAEVAIKRIENSTWQRSGWVCPVGAAWCVLPDLPTLLLPNLVSLCDRPTRTTNTSARTLDEYQNSCFHYLHCNYQFFKWLFLISGGSR